MSAPIEGRRVCVVMEAKRKKPREWHLYGVFADEAMARADYGDEDEKHLVEFHSLPVWSR